MPVVARKAPHRLSLGPLRRRGEALSTIVAPAAVTLLTERGNDLRHALIPRKKRPGNRSRVLSSFCCIPVRASRRASKGSHFVGESVPTTSESEVESVPMPVDKPPARIARVLANEVDSDDSLGAACQHLRGTDSR
ncbi:MAG: hypothetical protein SGPRY_012299, partial [Prymnesium sp.]